MEADALVYKIAYASLRLPIEAARVLLTRFEDERDFMTAPESRFPAQLKLPRSCTSLTHRTQLVNEARQENDFIDNHGIRPIYFTDEDYPQRLLECGNAPLMLYCLGNCDLNHARILSIVGTRHATIYGTGMVEEIVKDLKQMMADPLVIVSGLAFGIDIAAHRAAMSCDLPTVGVLAQGLNTIYPPQHRQAAVSIVQNGGMLLTDYRKADVLHRGNFLARNRIIAGLADCVLVAESSEKGGALNTASLAQGYDRDVLALPGRANDPYSRGCNHLIATNRAAICTCAQDIMSQMSWSTKPETGQQPELPNLDLKPEERALLKLLEIRGEARQAELMEVLGMTQKDLSAMLIDMEFRNLVASMPGGRYRLGNC